MNEQEWLGCTHPWLMFDAANATDRKFRLFACACYRLNWWSLTDDLARNAVLLAEHYSDGRVSWKELNRAERSSHPACWHLTCKVGRVAAWDVVDDAWSELIEDNDAGEKLAPLASLFREIIGNPFHPPADDATWRTLTVTSLATAAYEKRALPSGELDTARLAVLADAFEEAGCTCTDLLEHLRSAGPHVRGCWALDLVLGKN